eukprot:TRINITY_DN12009_c0_g1_i1.p1 TRINITY_DN12009_c0_g1~~TRINITY_DN12009_c0_g1_i1.p1  ORF type:complete len:237 (+),score=73.44 TRINITY_DN12009_c0_g1_i1:174-884(+)
MKRVGAGESEGSKAPEAKRAKRPLYGGFIELVREVPEAPKDDFPQLPKGSCSEAANLASAVRAEDADKTKQPYSFWWTMTRDAPPVGPVQSSRLSLSKLDKDVCVVALVAEVPDSTKGTTSEFDTDRVARAKTEPAWICRLVEDPDNKEKRKDVLRVKRASGVKKGGAWFVGVLVRQNDESGWQAETIDEVYPSKRVANLLALRCKEIIPPAPAAKEESTMDAARKILEDAMKSGL